MDAILFALLVILGFVFMLLSTFTQKRNPPLRWARYAWIVWLGASVVYFFLLGNAGLNAHLSLH
jgi:hypothetical protein